MRRIPAVMLVAVLATGAGAAQASATTAREAKATKHHAKPKVKHKAKSGPKLTVGETFAASGNGQSYKVTLISYTRQRPISWPIPRPRPTTSCNRESSSTFSYSRRPDAERGCSGG
jgi:hypothetical protein